MSLFTGFDNIIRTAEPLAPLTWLRIGGNAEYFAEPTTTEQLASLITRCREEDVPVRLLGDGSNVLIRDEGVPGMVVKLTGDAFDSIDIQGRTILAGGAAKLGHVVSAAVRAGLAGLESLVGIPGTVGGALHGNAGSRGGDVGQWTCHATVITRAGEIHERSREDLVFAYRQSSLDELVIIGARMELDEEDPEELTKRMQKQWIVKKANQPLAHQSAGCVFKNPRGMSAGMLIEQAGLKGAQVGKAVVSDRHANFIIADSGATGQDVLKLIDLVKSRVLERLGVELEREIEIW